MKNFNDIANGDIREILKILESNPEIKIKYEAHYVDYFYQLKEDSSFVSNGPFEINSDGNLFCNNINIDFNTKTKHQSDAIEVVRNYSKGYPIETFEGIVDFKKPIYYGNCFIWCFGYLDSIDFIQKIKEFLDEYDDLEDDEMIDDGIDLFTDEFLAMGSDPEDFESILECENIKLYDNKLGFGTKIGSNDISWCITDQFDRSELNWILE